MNEIEYLLRIILQARDQTAAAFKSAKQELAGFVTAVESHNKKLDSFNNSLKTMETNMGGVTEKLREWRTMMQGMTDDNGDTQKSIGALNKELGNTINKTTAATKANKELREESRRLRQQGKELEDQFAKGKISTDDLVNGYQRLGSQLDTLSKKFGTVTSEDFRRNQKWAQSFKDSANQIIGDNERIRAEREKTAKDFEKSAKMEDSFGQRMMAAAKQRMGIIQKEAIEENRIRDNAAKQRMRGIEEEAHFINRAYDDGAKQRFSILQKSIRDEQRLRAKAARDRELLEASEMRLGRARGEIQSGAISPRTLLDLRQASTGFKRLSSAAREGSHEQDQFALKAEESANALRKLKAEESQTSDGFARFRQKLQQADNGVAGLDNRLRGMALLAIVGFAEQLISVITALGGELVALASSAAMAGAALGGIFVAGIAQAIPALGLFAAAMMRVKTVMQAVQQAQLMQQQQAVQRGTGAKRDANAADALKNAQEGLADAHRRLAEAQKNLTDAREKGRRELQDLIKAENDAKLAAIGAALSQKEAQQALIRAQQQGDVEGIQRAQLGILQAQADAQDKLTQKRRAAADAGKARAGGVEGLDSVQNAKKQVEDAERAVEKARRGIDTAKRHADEAAAGTQTAAAKLNFLLAQLSPAEKRLYDAMTRLQELFRTGVYRSITDNLVNSFARAVEKITQILERPDIINAAKRLSMSLSRELNRIFDSFTDNKTIEQFKKITEAGRRNLRPLGSIIESLGHSFLNIAETAGPALSNFLKFVGDLADSFEKLTGQKGKMTDFFTTGEKHLEAWIDLGIAVINLFLALAGAGGAESGKRSIEDATKAINSLADSVEKNQGKVRKFFDDARRVTNQVVGVVVSLAKELFRAWEPKRVQNFATLLKDVILPALGDIIVALGHATDRVIEFANSDFGKAFLRFLLAAIIGFQVMQHTVLPVLNVVLSLGSGLSQLSKWFKEAELAARLFGAASLGSVAIWAIVIVALIAGFVLLLKHFGLLDDAWDAVKKGAEAFLKEVKPSLKQLIDAFSELNTSAGPVLKWLLTALVNIAKVALPIFGRMLGRMVGGVIDMLTGLIKFLNDVFHLRFAKAFDDLLDIIRGWQRIALAPFRAWIEAVGAIFRQIGRFAKRGLDAAWKAVKEFGRDVGEFFSNLWARLKRGWGRMSDAISDAFNDAWKRIKSWPSRMGGVAKDAANAVIDAFKDVGTTILKRIVTGASREWGWAKSLANTLFKYLEDAWNNTIGKLKIGPLNVPDLHLPRLATGGPVPGSGSGDTVAAWLTPGEHVWTKAEVEAAGGHGVMYAMRRFFGGGGQGRGNRLADGGAPGAGGALTISFQGGSLDEFRSDWRQFWLQLVAAARIGANRIEDQFRDMRVNTTRSADRMYRDVRGSIADIQNSFKTRGDRIVSSWADTWLDLQKVAYDGLFYIAHETNRALHGLDEKTINFGLTQPKKSSAGKAGGGWIGNKGQRGRDRGFYALGDGEAVLNWQHQKYVEPAMHAFYGHGLGTMFNRVHGMHAGGAGQPGFAGGGYTFGPVPGFPGEEANTRIIPLLVKLLKKYGGFLTDAYDRDHSAGHKSPGHNVTGTAADIVPKVQDAAGWNRIEALGKWAVSQGMIVGYGAGVPGSQPWPGHGRGLHIHIEFGTGKGPKVAAGDLPGATEATKIGRPIVTGGGKLAAMVQAAIDKVLKAANSMLSESFDSTSGGATDFAYKAVKAGAGNIFKYFVQHGFTDEQAAGWVGNFIQESGLVPSAVQPNGEGHGLAQWGHGRFDALVKFAGSKGKKWTDLGAQLAYVMYELHGPESAAYAAIKKAKTVEEATNAIGVAYERFGIQGDRSGPARQAFKQFHGKFAAGGIVPGGDGRAVDITAHAGEWVLNKVQQARLAALTGLSRSGLASMLGFHGGKHGHFQGGGVLQIGDSLSVGMEKALRAALKKMGEKLTSDVKEGRGSGEAFEILKRKLTAAYRAVIFDVGTNDAQATTLKKNLGKAYRQLHEGQQLVVGTVHGPGAEDKNAVIRAFAKAHSDVVKLVETTTKGIGKDRIHLNAAGYKTRGGQFARAVGAEDAATGGGAADAEGIVALTTKEVKSITDKALRGMVVASRKILLNYTGDQTKGILGIATKLGSVSSWTGEINKELTALGQIAKRAMGKKIKAADADLAVRGFADAMDQLIGENGAFARLRGRIERVVGQTSRARTRQRFAVREGRIIDRADNYDVLAAGDTLTDLRSQRGMLIGEQGQLRTAQRQIQRQLRRKGLSVKTRERLRTEQKQVEGMLDEADERVADNITSIYDAQQNYLQALLDAAQKGVDKVVEQYERGRSALDRMMRRFTAVGDDAGQASVAAQVRENMQAEAAALQAQLVNFQGINTPEAEKAIHDINEQIADLQTQIFESLQQSLKDAVDQINTNAQRRLGHLDLGNRLLDALGTVGLFGTGSGGGKTPFLNSLLAQQGMGSTFSRAAIFAQRGNILQGQYGQLQGQLGVAQQYGNIGMIKDLTDQLAELEVAMAENTKALFDARIQDVNNTHDYTQSMLDLNLQLVDLNGQINGQVDAAAKLALTQQKGNDLAAKGQELAALLAETIPGTQPYLDLQKAILENTVAQAQNTVAVNELSGANQGAQTFSSSAWQWFREAIFGGMGQVLPQYDPGNAMTGIATGAMVVAPNSTSTTTGVTNNITLNEAGRPVDLTEVTAAVTFASKTAQ